MQSLLTDLENSFLWSIQVRNQLYDYRKLVHSSNCHALRQMTARTGFICQETPLLELHVNAAARGIDSYAVLRGRNANYHTGLI
jgi:hypothetical protein